jgi:hypothetical protein
MAYKNGHLLSGTIRPLGDTKNSLLSKAEMNFKILR